MHNNFNESKADNNFRSWLKERKCPDEIISDILKENSRWHYRTLEKRIKSCPRLFTALLDNGYEYKAIKHIFLDNHYSGYHFNRLVKQEDIAIELVKNKCKYLNIPLMCRFENGDSEKFFNNKEFYIKLLERLSPLSGLSISDILNFFVVDCNKQKLKKCMSNPKLLNLLIENYLPSKMLKGILEKDDYKTLSINNNKKLLGFLLKENLIFADNDYPNDKHRKKLVTEDKMVNNLLQTNDLKISDLLYHNGSVFESTAPDIRKRAEEVAESIELRIKETQAQSNLPDTHHAKAPCLAKQVMEKLEHNQSEVQSLVMLSICAALKSPLIESNASKKIQIVDDVIIKKAMYTAMITSLVAAAICIAFNSLVAAAILIGVAVAVIACFAIVKICDQVSLESPQIEEATQENSKIHGVV